MAPSDEPQRHEGDDGDDDNNNNDDEMQGLVVRDDNNKIRQQQQQELSSTTKKKPPRNIIAVACFILLVATIFSIMIVYTRRDHQRQQEQNNGGVLIDNKDEDRPSAIVPTNATTSHSSSSSGAHKTALTSEEEKIAEEPTTQDDTTTTTSSSSDDLDTTSSTLSISTTAANTTTADAARQAIKQLQIDNFRNNNHNESLFLNFHITHHGGTTVCREVGYRLKRPSFVCLHPKKGDNVHDFPGNRPWSHDETATNIARARKNFEMIAWEFSKGTKDPKPADTNWEDPHLVSLLVMREPLSRALAGDGSMNKKYPSIWMPKRAGHNATKAEWMQFAKQEKIHNNNYALRILTDSTCCDGANTPRHYLEEAKALVDRFTFVLDIACLQHGLEKVADTLGFKLQEAGKSQDHHHETAKEKIPFPEVYDYLVEKNKLDIELYEYAKNVSLVNCDEVLGG